MLRCLLVFLFSSTVCVAGVSERNVDPLIVKVREVMSRSQLPAVGIAIVTPDRVIWAGGLGEATSGTLFRLGSISKSFVALALLKLASEGKIDLDATLESVASEIDVPNPWRATDPVRIAHVLEHTAGFDDSRFAEDYYPPGLEPGAVAASATAVSRAAAGAVAAGEAVRVLESRVSAGRIPDREDQRAALRRIHP
jgi:CubicO group peptidase (beta-lactamase class C family)